jgi:hypothetical protein
MKTSENSRAMGRGWAKAVQWMRYSFSRLKITALLQRLSIICHGCLHTETVPLRSFLQDHFVELMKLQIRDYIGRQMCRQATLPQNSRTVSSLFSAVNWLMMLSLASHGTNLAQSNVNMRADSGTSDATDNTRLHSLTSSREHAMFCMFVFLHPCMDGHEA